MEGLNLETGEVVYATPEEGNTQCYIFRSGRHFFFFFYLGASFSLWTGGIASAVDGVAVLVCVAMNGFHSKMSYQWYSKAGILNMATHPVIYVECPGDYSCVVTGENVEEKQVFRVSGT